MIGDILDFEVPRPQKWEQMLEIAEKLAIGQEQARVDLYVANGKIFFGELTFTAAAGFSKSYGKEILQNMGSEIKLDLNKPYNRFARKSRIRQ